MLAKAGKWEDKEDTFHDGGVRRGVLEARGNNGPPSDLQSGIAFLLSN